MLKLSLYTFVMAFPSIQRRYQQLKMSRKYQFLFVDEGRPCYHVIYLRIGINSKFDLVGFGSRVSNSNHLKN